MALSILSLHGVLYKIVQLMSKSAEKEVLRYLTFSRFVTYFGATCFLGNHSPLFLLPPHLQPPPLPPNLRAASFLAVKWAETFYVFQTIAKIRQVGS